MDPQPPGSFQSWNLFPSKNQSWLSRIPTWLGEILRHYDISNDRLKVITMVVMLKPFIHLEMKDAGSGKIRAMNRDSTFSGSDGRKGLVQFKCLEESTHSMLMPYSGLPVKEEKNSNLCK